MAKKKSTTKKADPKGDAERAIILAVLSRAQKRVEGAMVDKKAAPEPGTYAVDASLVIQGDVVVAEPVKIGPGEDKTERTFSSDQLLGALFAGQNEATIRAQVNEALKRHEEIFAAPDDASVKPRIREQLAAAMRAIGEGVQEACAKRRALTRVVPGGGGGTRKGAVTGDPEVRVNGSFGTRSVELEFAAA